MLICYDYFRGQREREKERERERADKTVRIVRVIVIINL